MLCYFNYAFQFPSLLASTSISLYLVPLPFLTPWPATYMIQLSASLTVLICPIFNYASVLRTEWWVQITFSPCPQKLDHRTTANNFLLGVLLAPLEVKRIDPGNEVVPLEPFAICLPQLKLKELCQLGHVHRRVRLRLICILNSSRNVYFSDIAKAFKNFAMNKQLLYILDHFRVAVNLIMKVRLSAKLFFAYKMKTNFHHQNFGLSLAFIMRFKATRKRPITK